MQRPSRGLVPHQLGQSHRRQILHHDQGDDAQQEDQQTQSAALEHSQVGLKANRGEEHDHADRLERLVKVEFHNTQRIEHAGQDGEHKAAHHRGGDTELLQHMDLLFHKRAQKQHGDRQCQRLVHIQRNDLHPLRPSPVSIFRAA